MPVLELGKLIQTSCQKGPKILPSREERALKKKKSSGTPEADAQSNRAHARQTSGSPSERSRGEIMATATALSLSGGGGSTPLLRGHAALASGRCCAFPRARWRPPRLSASRADDSSPAPFEMTVEGALKLLGVAEGASFDEILRAKNAVLASCKDDQDAVAQVPETLPTPATPNSLLYHSRPPFVVLSCSRE